MNRQQLNANILMAKDAVKRLLNDDRINRYAPLFFTYTDDILPYVLMKLRDATIPEIEVYKPRFKRTRMTAFVTPEHDVIYLNVYKYHTVESLVTSIGHELCHCCNYQHGGNAIHWWNRKKKMASVPYAIGNALGRMYKDEIK